MKIITDKTLFYFEAWGEGKVTLDNLSYDQCEIVENIIDECYPDGIDETALNDFLAYDKDTIADWLGYQDWQDLLDNQYAEDPQ